MDEARLTSQKSFSLVIDENAVDQLKLKSDNDRDKARINSLSIKHSGDWLNAVPVRALGLHLQPLEFTTSVKYRLGIPVYETTGLCKACKTAQCDKYGDHSVGCGSEGERIYRHNSLRDVVYATAKTAALSPAREERSLLPGSADKPADVFLPGWATGRDAALDVSVVSPLQQQLVRKAAYEAGSAARKRFQEKNAKYYQPCADEGIMFFPLIIELRPMGAGTKNLKLPSKG